MPPAPPHCTAVEFFQMPPFLCSFLGPVSPETGRLMEGEHMSGKPNFISFIHTICIKVIHMVPSSGLTMLPLYISLWKPLLGGKKEQTSHRVPEVITRLVSAELPLCGAGVADGQGPRGSIV